MWIFTLFWNNLTNSSNFSGLPSKAEIVVVRDSDSFEILILVFLNLSELLLLVNCWRDNKDLSASIAAGVFSLLNFGWLVECAFFCLPEDVRGEHYGNSSWTLVTIWEGYSQSESIKLLFRRASLQDGNPSGNDLHLVPGFSPHFSGIFPKKFRRVSVHVGSGEISLF